MSEAWLWPGAVKTHTRRGRGLLGTAAHGTPCEFFDSFGGRYWDRTSDLFRVKEARYPCANRPAGSILPQESRPQDARDIAFPSQHTRWGFVRGFVPRLEFHRTRSCVRADVAQW